MPYILSLANVLQIFRYRLQMLKVNYSPQKEYPFPFWKVASKIITRKTFTADNYTGKIKRFWVICKTANPYVIETSV